MISAYHPFYITDDKEGGYQYKTTSQRRKTKVFSGIENNRLSGATPTGIGRLCEWREDPQQPAESFSSFGAYQASISKTLIKILFTLRIKMFTDVSILIGPAQTGAFQAVLIIC